MRIFLLLLLLVGLHAAETLSIDVTATTIPTGRPKNGNDNAVALWVVGSGGTLTKTISRWVGTSTNPGARNGYTGLTWWRSFTGGTGDVDGYVGPTRTSYSGLGTQTWNMSTKSGGTAPDGTYTVWMELASNSPTTVTGTSVTWANRTSFTFTKNGTASNGTISGGGYTGTWTYSGRTVVPTITTVSPANGTTAGNTAVTITGENFTGVTAVTFGGSAATLGTITATSIACTTPARTTAGPVDVVVTAPGGSATKTGGYTYTVPTAVSITALDPNTGLTTGGRTVTISGTGLTGTSAITFGGTAATNITVVNATRVTCTTPARAAGTVDVVLTATAGSTTSTGGFTYLPPAPTISSVNPATGDIAGGATVTLTGTNLTGATAVTFGSTAATGLTVVSATQLTCIAPALAAGTVAVAVTTPGGTASLAAAYTATSTPAITGVSPSQGGTGGGTTLTLTGSNLGGTTSVTVGGVAATAVTVVNATQVTCVTPARAAGTVDVVASNGTLSTTATGAFTYGSSSNLAYVSFQPSAAGGNYAPNHVLAVWVASASGTFVKTIGNWSETRRSNLTQWLAVSAGGDTDAVMGATRSAAIPVNNLTWDLRDRSGALITDGNYLLWIELADDNSPPAGTTSVPGARRTSLAFTIAGGAITEAGPVTQDGFASLRIGPAPGTPVGSGTATNVAGGKTAACGSGGIYALILGSLGLLLIGRRRG